MDRLAVFEWILRELFTVLGAVVISWGWGRLVELLWTLDFDRRRRLAYTVAPLRFILVLTVWLSFVFPPWQVDLSIAIAVATGVSLLGTAWAIGNLRDIAGGIAISVTQPFAIGDHISTGTVDAKTPGHEVHGGEVVALHLTRVEVRTPMGSILTVPAGALSTGVLHVASPPRRALPIQVVVPLPRGRSHDAALWTLRDHAYLSAYVDSAAPVVVELVDESRAKIHATPVRPEDSDELRSDLIARAAD